MSTKLAIPIARRDIHFDLSGVDLDYWHPAGPHVSHYFNVKSLLFPEGERFFIRSVRHFRQQISDPELQQQVTGFIGQEAMHGREHEAYNEKLADIGYRVDQVERFLTRSFSVAERFLSPKTCLAMTVALEHITAIGAEDTLADERILADAHPEMARLWRWHALEESEHKAVAFDVYTQVVGAGLLAWLRRCLALAYVSVSMQAMIWIGLIRVLYRSGHLFQFSGWKGLIWMLWVKPGIFRREIPHYFQFFKPSFHPWDNDNHAQIQRWVMEYGQDVTSESASRV